MQKKSTSNGLSLPQKVILGAALGVNLLSGVAYSMGSSPSRGDSNARGTREWESRGSFFQEGREKGWSSGYSLAENIASKVLGTLGCSGLWKYEGALERVIREVRLPSSQDGGTEFGRGYLEGYREGIMDSSEKTRELCHQLVHESGGFVGRMNGEYACAVIRLDTEAFAQSSLQLGWYPDWSGGRSEREWECRQSMQDVLEACVGSQQSVHYSWSWEAACRVGS